jgi:hypothetical protein
MYVYICYQTVRRINIYITTWSGAGIAQWCSAGLRAGWSGFRVPVGARHFFFTTASRPALGPTQPHVQWVPEALSLEVKRPGRGADYSPKSSAEIKNAWSYTSTPQYTSMAWCLVKTKITGAHLPFTLQWSRVLEKLTVSQLLKKLPTFYRIRNLIIVFAKSHHWSLSWVRWNQTTSQNISLISV